MELSGAENTKNSPLFSILVVSLNPGDKLVETIESIRKQNFTDYQVVVKDGGSKDGSMEKLNEYLKQWQEGAGRVEIVVCKDSSIYDGMNQAVSHAKGQYLYFLNCGDSFADEDALKQVAEAVLQDREKGQEARLYYGNILDVLRGQVVSSNPHIDAFACYRHVPCHQACIYSGELFAERGYRPEYRVRADYEHFLYCFYEEKAKTFCMPHVICFYEGGGYSETAKNRKISARQHREITKKYMGSKALCYRLIMLLTLAPLRTKLSQSKYFSHFYNAIKTTIYKKRR